MFLVYIESLISGSQVTVPLPSLSLSPLHSKVSSMNCGPVSIAPGPVSLNNDQRSQNFDNIRSGFEGQQKAPKPVISAPSPTPRNRSRSTKSPTPPR